MPGDVFRRHGEISEAGGSCCWRNCDPMNARWFTTSSCRHRTPPQNAVPGKHNQHQRCRLFPAASARRHLSVAFTPTSGYQLPAQRRVTVLADYSPRVPTDSSMACSSPQPRRLALRHRFYGWILSDNGNTSYVGDPNKGYISAFAVGTALYRFRGRARTRCHPGWHFRSQRRVSGWPGRICQHHGGHDR